MLERDRLKRLAMIKVNVALRKAKSASVLCLANR